VKLNIYYGELQRGLVALCEGEAVHAADQEDSPPDVSWLRSIRLVFETETDLLNIKQ
jgi:hypothetical protein